MRAALLSAMAFAGLIAAGGAHAQAPGEPSAFIHIDCDRDCLIGFAREYMQALAKRDPSKAHFARNVRFTENDVELTLGKQGLWATVTGVAAAGLEAADPSTGEVAWLGTVEEHDQPVYYAMRLRVQHHQIAEVETVVVRRTGLPLPFGDTTKLTHDPAFAEVLPPGQRRPRERLIAVTDSYFNTVELNDGVVFAPFDAECARTENGIVTTAAVPGSAGSMAQGCENQFKLGIYRINKRVRERRYTLVDEERGVVVATGFFDHANTFDTYKTTDGKEHKTLLKWPNSISLIEAFKIRDGRIYRIEAVFTYVPYFMHSPFYPAIEQQRPGDAGATARASDTEGNRHTSAPPRACDRECLIGFAQRYMEALVRQKPEELPWAEHVRFTENSVPMMIGDGLWGSIGGKSDSPLIFAEPATGTAVWMGLVQDHDAPAYYAMRLKVAQGRISEVETAVSRKFNPGPFGDPAAYRNDPLFTEAPGARARTSRAQLTALVENYFRTEERNDGHLFAAFDTNCDERENGAWITRGEGFPAVVAHDTGTPLHGCEAPLRAGLYWPIERVRNRRVLLVDAAHGVVVASSFADYPVREMTYTRADDRKTPLRVQDSYPSARERFQLFKVRGGRIERIEGVSVFQPYGMPSPWAHSKETSRP